MMADLDYAAEKSIEQGFESIIDKIEEARTAFGDLTDELDEVDLDDVAMPAIVALSGLVALVNELREAGATIAEVPGEEAALVTVIANGTLIQKDIAADIAHMEKMIERVTP